MCWSWDPSRPQTPWTAPGGRGDIRMTGWVCGSTLVECTGRESASVRHAPAVVSRSASTSRSGASHPRSGPSGLRGSGCHTFWPPSSHCGTRHVRRPTASTAASHEMPGARRRFSRLCPPLPKELDGSPAPVASSQGARGRARQGDREGRHVVAVVSAAGCGRPQGTTSRCLAGGRTHSWSSSNSVRRT
jgi:hypothetical protein